MFARFISTDKDSTTILIRIMVGAVFLSEGIQKFLFPAKLGAGRFQKIGIPNPEFFGPFVGVITVRNADRGTLVGNNQSILTIQRNNKLRLRVAVPEVYVASGAIDKTAGFRVDAYPNKLFQATLTRKSESINPQTRTELNQPGTKVCNQN